MDSLPKLINQYPELLEITRPTLKNVVYTQTSYCPHFIESLIQIYNFFFEIEPVLFVPKHFHNLHEGSIIGDLENLENFKSNGIIIFAYSDILFNEVLKINKRRLNTILKNCKKSKVIILGITNLKILEIPILETYNFICLPNNCVKNMDISLFDLVDKDQDIFNQNLESFVEMINGFKDKRIYISLNLPNKQLLELESLLKLTNTVVRKEQENENKNIIVINSCKTTQKTLLKQIYDIYIYSLPDDLEYLDLISYFKDTFQGNQQVYLDSLNNEYTEKTLMNIYKDSCKRLVIQDSKQTFDKLESIKIDKLGSISIDNFIIASEEYYVFNSPESIQRMDLRNLTKKDYDTIRNFIKQRLINKFDLDVKTCQLSTPCSPKDRSRKLNSLSNKISSVDYRCDVTCEIFKDYTIGVVIWNETFTTKEEIKCLKNETYVYQTTSGKWKYTTIY
jgi:hypothetical protein